MCKGGSCGSGSGFGSCRSGGSCGTCGIGRSCGSGDRAGSCVIVDLVLVVVVVGLVVVVNPVVVVVVAGLVVLVVVKDFFLLLLIQVAQRIRQSDGEFLHIGQRPNPFGDVGNFVLREAVGQRDDVDRLLAVAIVQRHQRQFQRFAGRRRSADELKSIQAIDHLRFFQEIVESEHQSMALRSAVEL